MMIERYGLAAGQTVGAVVLAGGLARRMEGQDKGLITLAGKPMAQYVLETLTPLVDSLVINANRNIEAYQSFGVPVISDILEGHLGPLAGLSAAMNALDTDYVFMCPCDSPFFQAELFSELMTQCARVDADIAVPNDGERLQPVFCVAHRRVQSSLNAFLAAGERKIDRWFPLHEITVLTTHRYAESFRNINTEQERLAAEKDLLQ